jgi:predicted Ser/Thr protein kinase
LGDYELLGRLGEGGMGTVYLGRSAQGRQVAIKVVRVELSHDDEFRRRFRSEVSRAQQVPPFSTAEVIDADPDHEPPYLVVEFVDGPSLAGVVRERGPITGSALHSVAVGIATALTAIHGAGVIHRDLKPGNVLFAMGGLKVIDFGIARPLELTSQHTRTDQMVGTVAYMAPERFEANANQRVSPAADIFAWGAVVAYAATGRTPFAADSAPATAMRIITQPPDLTGLSGVLRDLVEWSLAKDPADRPTARQLLDRLLAADRQPAGNDGAQAARAVQWAAGRLPAGVPGIQTAPQAVAPQSGAPQSGAPQSGAPQTAAVAMQPPADGSAAPPRRRHVGRNLAVALFTVVLLVAVAVTVRAVAGDRGGSGSNEAGGSGPGAPTTSAGASPSPEPVPTGLPGIFAGKRRTLLHLAEIDKDLALPLTGEAQISGGTIPEAQFALVNVGVDFLIKSMTPSTTGEERCLGAKRNPRGASRLVAATCTAAEATVFSITETDGGKDDKGRQTYTLYNDSFGVVQWSEQSERIFVEQLGDAPPLTTFSFVERDGEVVPTD